MNFLIIIHKYFYSNKQLQSGVKLKIYIFNVYLIIRINDICK